MIIFPYLVDLFLFSFLGRKDLEKIWLCNSVFLFRILILILVGYLSLLGFIGAEKESSGIFLLNLREFHVLFCFPFYPTYVFCWAWGLADLTIQRRRRPLDSCLAIVVLLVWWASLSTCFSTLFWWMNSHSAI